jgi:hypothetical protein
MADDTHLRSLVELLSHTFSSKGNLTHFNNNYSANVRCLLRCDIIDAELLIYIN